MYCITLTRLRRDQISNVGVWERAAPTLPWLPRGGETRGELYANGSYKHFNTLSGPVSAQWYCDKLATNLEPWIAASGQLDVADVIVGVYTGESLFHTRAMTSAATWLTRFPHAYLYAATGSATVPVIGLGARYHLQPDYVTMSDVQPLQIVAVRDMYLRHPNAKWFYIVGDDTYVIAG